MRNRLKAATLESRFPVLKVENGCIISKDADVTLAYRVDLPEVFTVSGAEYEAIHAAWVKAVKALPDWSVVCKQDWFTQESCVPDYSRGEPGFLSRSFEQHFAARPYLDHHCFLYLTKTTRQRMRRQSAFSSLGRGSAVPAEMLDRDAMVRFAECCDQFRRIVNESGFVRLTQLTDGEIAGWP